MNLLCCDIKGVVVDCRVLVRSYKKETSGLLVGLSRFLIIRRLVWLVAVVTRADGQTKQCASDHSFALQDNSPR